MLKFRAVLVMEVTGVVVKYDQLWKEWDETLVGGLLISVLHDLETLGM